MHRRIAPAMPQPLRTVAQGRMGCSTKRTVALLWTGTIDIDQQGGVFFWEDTSSARLPPTVRGTQVSRPQQDTARQVGLRFKHSLWRFYCSARFGCKRTPRHKQDAGGRRRRPASGANGRLPTHSLIRTGEGVLLEAGAHPDSRTWME